MVPPTVSELQLMVPGPSIQADVVTAAAFCWRIAPVTVKVTLALTVKTALLELALLIVIELIVAFAVTVTKAPATITAVSPLAGTTPPTQVLVEFQLPPDAVVVLVVPRAVNVPSRVKIIARTE